ncbi:YhjD/YihY/BrkB family envelope integrity protein [Pseudodesulfovibrio sp. zrk46]|uniref:YhjD/YihY/BrkB family envelope integrity protein n=1 Tax=Pseudodesulfovibrio sp. zrk46 TaxID=2725288 RepID=UPI001448B3DE|nr:YhjD/YihY/BrkB family envelope integrity protein [Pseudodesulfovibrio sp. zrk46]QJB57592.1 YihY family inner membrane protein [Pseudodesulfovibrio sp. zrk46]
MTPAKIVKTKLDFKQHFSESIWKRNAPGTPLHIKIWRGACRLSYLIGFGFFKDQCIIRAAALTFTTILSIVPFLAVAFSISKGFGLQNSEMMREWVLRLTTGRPEVADKIIEYIDRTNVQALGWVGVATLLFTVLSLIGTIEKAFNTIWHVQKGRSTWRKVTDFFPVIVFGPIILFVASSFNVSLQQQEIVAQVLSVEAIGYLEAMFLKMTPYMLIIFAFSMMYAFIPYVRVKFSSALIGGMVGGILWQLAQWGYIHWQIGAAKYNAIYGSFAQFPVLLMWIYISWVIVLLGAEVSYSWQNINSFVKQRYFGEATPFERQKIAVLMMIVLTKRFHRGQQLPSVEEISDGLMAPTSLVSDLFILLQKAGYTVLTENQEQEVYAPARALDKVRILEIIRVVNMDADNRVFQEFAEKFGFLDKLFEKLGEATMGSEANMTLLECAEKYPAYVLDIIPEEDAF